MRLIIWLMIAFTIVAFALDQMLSVGWFMNIAVGFWIAAAAIRIGNAVFYPDKR